METTTTTETAINKNTNPYTHTDTHTNKLTHTPIDRHKYFQRARGQERVSKSAREKKLMRAIFVVAAAAQLQAAGCSSK